LLAFLKRYIILFRAFRVFQLLGLGKIISLKGEFIYDTKGVDSMPSDPMSGLYPSDSFSLTVAGYSFDASDNSVSVINDSVLIQGTEPVDAFEIVSALREVAGPSLSGLPSVQMDLVMADTDALVFNNDALPATLDLDDFVFNLFLQ
jgi:hypothetical protein